MPENKQLQDKLIEWLEKQGYPHEMEVALAFQNHGFRVFQSDYYDDPETGDKREIDLIAFKDADSENFKFRISFAVECKSSYDKPWVLFTSNKSRINNYSRVMQRASSESGKKLLLKLTDREDVKDFLLFNIGKRPAYGITQGFTSGADVTFAAINGAAKAAIAKVAKPVSKTFHLVFPIVCVGGRLFEYFINDDGDKKLEEIKHGTLLWRNPLLGTTHTIIPIVTSSAITEYLDAVSAEVEILLNSCTDECEEILKNSSVTLSRRVLSSGLKR
ncbi:MAG: hypothetical protein EHM79_13915 [Geobacter sp.]|nr:MAG: hypothetical protein EHM79_13915 [Geobacter sp.]